MAFRDFAEKYGSWISIGSLVGAIVGLMVGDIVSSYIFQGTPRIINLENLGIGWDYLFFPALIIIGILFGI